MIWKAVSCDLAYPTRLNPCFILISRSSHTHILPLHAAQGALGLFFPFCVFVVFCFRRDSVHLWWVDGRLFAFSKMLLHVPLSYLSGVYGEDLGSSCSYVEPQDIRVFVMQMDHNYYCFVCLYCYDLVDNFTCASFAMRFEVFYRTEICIS